jgi:F-type H+-transporting ATPase subunit b
MDEKAWVALSFFIFIIAIYKPLSKLINANLDARSEQIKRDLQEAKELKEQAQNLLESFRKKHAKAEKEIEELIAATEHQSKIMLEDAQKNLDIILKNRKQQFLKKIANNENSAIKELSKKTIDNVIQAATTAIAANINDDLNQYLIDDSIAQIKQQL